MRLVMMATGPFAGPSFRALYDTPHDVVALVSQPPRASRGKRPAPENSLRQLARERGTPVLDPESINTPEAHEALQQLTADLFVVADYGQILSDDTLACARLGGINLHGSLLPKYRGAAPINWAIYHGETESGVSVIHMTPRLDAGPVLAQRSLAIGPAETAAELEPRLAELGAPLVCEVIDMLAAGRVEPLPQDPQLATRARRLRKSDGEVDWSRSAAALHNQVRAWEPWPRSATSWHRGEGGTLRLILGRVSVAADTCADAPKTAAPGTVVRAEGDQLLVATGEGLLSIDEVQPAGKRQLSTAEFLRGYPVQVGDRLGPE